MRIGTRYIITYLFEKSKCFLKVSAIFLKKYEKRGKVTPFGVFFVQGSRPFPVFSYLNRRIRNP